MTGFNGELRAHGDRQGGVSPTSLQKQVGEIRILDIRSEKQYAKEHIDTAVVLPLKEISESRLTQLGFQKSDEIVVYGNSEIPAKKAKLLLNAMDYTRVKILSGGWKEDGFPTVSGKMAVTLESKKESMDSSIRIRPSEYEFGILRKEGGIVATTFSLFNEGNKKVRIEEVSTSCGCTTARLPKEIILPGEAVIMEVSFDPNFHKEPEGRFSRTIFLQTSEGIELEAKIYVQIKD
jgi:rhodanese-related sulfurtransferase